jgi:hypothetical protein
MDLPVVTTSSADVIALAGRLESATIAGCTSTRATARYIDWLDCGDAEAYPPKRFVESAIVDSPGTHLIPWLAARDFDHE